MEKTHVPLSILLILLVFLSGCKDQVSPGTDQDLTWEKGDPVPESVIKSTRLLREHLLDDPYRPAYHFCLPEDEGRPGDPNGAFFHNGRYHLMYLYHRVESGFSWGHVSSTDLLHWRHHPDAIGPGNGDQGVFSGGGFVNSQGEAVITYWEFMSNETRDAHAEGTYRGRTFGIGIAKSSKDPFDTWVKSPANPVIPSTDWGITKGEDGSGNELIYGSADPSQIWMKDGRYYMLTGNLLVLRKYGMGPEALPDSLMYQGDRLYLFVSDDMEEWEYLHEFYKSDRKWTHQSEDNMCPSFLPLPSGPDGGEPSGKHLLLFISHNKGCQYYVGSYTDDRFLPDNHGRMTWTDNAYFAPEAMVDGKGRQLMWSWIFDDRPEELQTHYGWTGTYGLPRSLWLGEDGTLRMRPVEELKKLRLEMHEMVHFGVKEGTEYELDMPGKELLELELTIEPGNATQVGVLVNCSDDGREQTALYYNASDKLLTCDATASSLEFGRRNVESGPFELNDGEPLVLRVFVDRSIVEVYANDRQAVTRRIYPTLGGTGVKLFAKGGDIKVISAIAWEITPSNPY